MTISTGTLTRRAHGSSLFLLTVTEISKCKSLYCERTQQISSVKIVMNVRVNIQTSVHFMCSILGSMESQISKPSIPYSCPHWETQRWQYKGREGQGDACIESRVRATQIAFYEFSRRYFQLYTFRNCKLLISTKCAGMGCDLPDIRITVCIGEAAIGDVHLYTLC